MSNEDAWKIELIYLLRNDLSELNLCFGSRNILRDLYYYTTEKTNYLQLGLFNQDIVVWYEKESLDISGFEKLIGIRLHNVDAKSKKTSKLIVPRIIIELKYNGVNTHTLITYSKISQDIKTIYPNCSYFFIMLYNGNSSKNKLLRNGSGFDKILSFYQGNAPKGNYNSGYFEKQLSANDMIKDKYQELLKIIKSSLVEKNKNSIK